MQYDKAKVTIDLEEYQCLKRQVLELSQSDAAMYRKVIFSILDAKGNINDSIEKCASHGIVLSLSHLASNFDQWQMIQVYKKEDSGQ